MILGGGESGTGAALLAQKLGYEVFLSDRGKVRDKYRNVLLQHGIRWEEGQHTPEEMGAATLMIKSPGIPDKAPVIKEAKARGIEVIGEIEFAWRHSKGKTVCITGTNGKTTTTLLTYHILSNAGLDVGLGGNVGRSYAALVAERDREWYVLELSSFQLDDSVKFRPDVAILTNITPDHLDRYDYRLENYVDAKFRITLNQQANDDFIYWDEDPIVREGMQRHTIRAKHYPFSLAKPQTLRDGAWTDGNNLTIHINKEELTMSIQDLALQGKHNLFNSMAAGAAQTIPAIM